MLREFHYVNARITQVGRCQIEMHRMTELTNGRIATMIASVDCDPAAQEEHHCMMRTSLQTTELTYHFRQFNMIDKKGADSDSSPKSFKFPDMFQKEF